MDTFTQEKRSWIMAQIKSSGAKSTEERLRIVMRGNGIRGWRRNFPLLGKPDFVFPKERVAVFVDGCFWHGHPEKCRVPKTNTEYWINKIRRNKQRDKEVSAALQKKGWKVVRIWEHMVTNPATVRRLRKVLRSHEIHEDRR